MEPERHKCTACGGTGDCPVCKGTSNGGQCTKCAGTGRCPNCHGTGRDREETGGLKAGTLEEANQLQKSR